MDEAEATEDRLAELLIQWEEQFELGKDMPVEELCRERPDLVAVLNERIQALKNVAWVARREASRTDSEQVSQPLLTPMRAVGDETIGGHKLIKPLGRGGFGEVWSAEASDGSRKAIKFIDQKWIHEWRGLQRMKNVQHPNVLNVEGVEEAGGTLVVVSELADCSLHEHFQKLRNTAQASQTHDRTVWSEAIKLLRDAADALDHMAEFHNLLHLDVKPTNLLLLGGRCKVGDFGAVLRACEGSPGETDAQVASVPCTWNEPFHYSAHNVFTPMYAPPEAFSGNFGRTYDQYSLALTFCELVAGRIPFLGELNSEMFLPLFRNVVSRALSTHPEERFPTCADFIEALAKCLGLKGRELKGRGSKRGIRLRGINGEVEGKTWESETILRAGRLTGLEIVLEDSSVSRRHAEIRCTQKGWRVRDLGSTNGTFLNGTRLGPGEWAVMLNDIVRFGNITLVVEKWYPISKCEQQETDKELPQPGQNENVTFVDAKCNRQKSEQPEANKKPPQPGHCKRLWNINIPGNRPLATPAIADNRVFVGGGFGSHEFYAFTADTGDQLWRHQTKDDGPTAAITLDGLVAFNTESCELEVLTVDGKPVWKRWLGDPLLTQPAAANGRIFIVYPYSQGDRQHYLGCFDLRTGEPIWHQLSGCDAITAPVLAEGNVYIATQDGMLQCFRQEDGKKMWTKVRNATSCPAIWNEVCFYSRREPSPEMVQNECLSKSHADGICDDLAKTWSRADYLDYSMRESQSDIESLAQTLDASVGFATSKGHSCVGQSQANLGQGTVAGIWSYQGSKPYVYRNRLYGCMGRHVQCLDPQSGEVIWKTRVVDDGRPLVDHELTPPVLVNGKVIVGTAHGELACLCAETGDWLWREIIGERIAFQPAVANGRIYVATHKGSLHCLGTGDPKDHGWFMWGGTPAHNGIDELTVDQEIHDGVPLIPSSDATIKLKVESPAGSLTTKHVSRILQRLKSLQKQLRFHPGLLPLAPLTARMNLPIADTLTDLPNRYAIVALAEREFRQMLASSTPLTLILLDVDKMKEINDRYLRAGGDAVLRQLGGVLVNTLLPGEFVGRFGGDRFLIVASNATEREANALAERVDRAIRQTTFSYRSDSIRITASFGIAVAHDGNTFAPAKADFPESGMSEELQPVIMSATRNLDEAKRRLHHTTVKRAESVDRVLGVGAGYER